MNVVEAQGKTDTETNFVVTVSFMTKVNHLTPSNIWPDLRSCLMIDLGRETDGDNEICLVRFALCVIKARPPAHIEHCSWEGGHTLSSFTIVVFRCFGIA